MGVVDNGLGPGGKVQSGLGLAFFEESCGAHDGSLGVASEAVFEDPCQFGAAERDVVHLGSQLATRLA